jgi:hypothetical protein
LLLAFISIFAKVLYFLKSLLVSKDLAVIKMLVKLRRTEPTADAQNKVLIRVLRGTHTQMHSGDISSH